MIHAFKNLGTQDIFDGKDSKEVLITFMKIPTHRPPTHPGEMLLEEFMIHKGLTPQKIAESIGVTEQQIVDLIAGKQHITPSLALRLSRFFGISVDFWMNLQVRWDLYYAQQAEAEFLNTINPFVA
jgi:addiction module HigA family antidote